MQNIKVEVGTTVFLEPHGNADRGWKKYPDRLPYEGTITAIGRKYFTVKAGHLTEKFEIKTLASHCDDCNSSYTLWESIEAWRDFTNAVTELVAIRDMLGRQRHEQTVEKLGTSTIHQIYDLLGLDAAKGNR